MVNRVVLVGRLTKNPELKRTNNGNPVTSFRLAFSNRTKNADGSPSSSFVNCTAWNKTAELVFQYCSKGSQLCVDGRLVEIKFQRKDGTNASRVEIVVENIELLGKKNTTEDKNDGYVADTSSDDVYEKESDSAAGDMADDDLPF